MIRPLAVPLAARLVLASLLLLAPRALAQDVLLDPAELTGAWHGAIDPDGLGLGIEVRFELVGGDALVGRIDIPAQGARDLPLAILGLAREALVFAIEGVPGEPTFRGAVADGVVEGTFTQGGQALPFRLERAAGAASPAAPLRPEDLAARGVWRGAIELPGAPLTVVVRLEPGPDGWTGTVDIPAQGLAGVPLRDIEVAAPAVRFRIEGIPGAPTFDGALGDDALEGTFRQGGASVPFALQRATEAEVAAAARRPQDPLPPLPYRAEEVAVRADDGVRLAGTLTVPEGPGPHPGVVLITGSGPQDRDEALAGHRPFAVLADALTRAGFATLRADDRGVGGSGGRLADVDYDLLVGDVLALAARLRAHPDVDAARVGLLGHSEGGYLAPLAALRDDATAFVVLLAGPSVDALAVLELQNRLLYESAGADAAAVEDQLAYLRELHRLVAAGELDAARRLTEAQVREQIAALPEEERPDAAWVEARASGQAEQVATPYFRAFLLHDPAPALKRLRVPVLALYGGLDVQVAAVQNAGPMRGLLRVAGNPDAEVIVLEGLNHLLQPARSGGLEEYATIETTIAPEALETISGWLRARFLP